MQLTIAQLTTLKTWLQANAANLNDQQAAALLNSYPAQDYFCWQTVVTKHNLVEQPSVDTDGVTPTAFNWTGFIQRSDAERDAWAELFNSTQQMRPALANVRKAFADIFSGGQTESVENRKHLWGFCQRKITTGEQLFVAETTDGPAQSGDRGTRSNPDSFGTGLGGATLEGNVTAQNVIDAWSL